MKPRERARSEKFSDVLRTCRMSKGLTRKEVAERTGISIHYQLLLEHGRRSVPTLGIIKKLEQAYGCEPLFLVTKAYKEA